MRVQSAENVGICENGPFEAPCKDCIARILPFAANRKSAPIGAPQGRIERPCFLSIHVFVCKQ